MRLLLSCVLTALLASTAAFTQNSATFEVWRDADLFKLSTNTTDSVTFKLVGSVATVTIEVKQAFNGRPTRRLQMTIPGFHGLGQYDPTTGASTYWENFSQTNSCDCFDHAINDITITKWDSTKQIVAGTFNWKCRAFSTGSGEAIDSRIRNGVFEYGAQKKIALTFSPADTLKIGNLANDTTVTLTITAKDGETPVAGAVIKLNDKLVDNGPDLIDRGATDANGVVSYTIRVKKNTPPGQYTIAAIGEKDGFRPGDTTKLLVTYGNRYWNYQCGGIDIMEFDAGEGKEWKPEAEGSTVIKTTGTVTVGGVIKLEGTVRIQTKEAEQKVFVDNGRVFIPEITYAPGDVGDLDLTNILTGNSFPLPDCNGIVAIAGEAGSEAATKKLQRKLPGGIEVALKEFKIIKRADAKGLSIKGMIKFNNARAGCDKTVDTTGGFNTNEDPKVGITVGFAATTQGLENFSIETSNISITNNWCIDKFSATADFVNSVYAIAGQLTFPIKGNTLTLGAGIVVKKNTSNPDGKLHFDSLQASLELGECKPIPETPLCFSTLSLSTSGWSNASANGRAVRATVLLKSAEQVVLDKFPKFVQAIGNPTIAEFEGTLEYRHPLIFTGSITSRMLKITKISASQPWQLEGTHSATIDFNNNIGISGSYKIGHLGQPDYFLSATGALTYYWKPTLGFSANVNGLVRIPTVGDSLLNVKYVGNVLKFMMLSGFIPQTLGNAQAAVLVNEDNGLSISASVDVTQNPVPYIRSFGRMSLSYTYKDGVPTFTTKADTIRPVPPKAGEEVQTPAQPSETITVDNSVERMFVLISGTGTAAAPVSTLTSPDGTVFSAAPPSDTTVQRFSTPNGEMVQWTIINPAVGNWTLSLTSPGAGDEVDIWFNRKAQPFTISSAIANRDVTVTWDPVMTHEGDVVRLFADVDAKDFDGVFITEVDAATGTATFPIPASLMNCSYTIHASLVSASTGITTVYAPSSVRLPNTTGIPSPVEVTAVSNQAGKTSVMWRMPVGSAVAGFVVTVLDESGRDSVYARAFSGDRAVVIDIENHQGKKISVTAYDEQGTTGCASDAVSIITAVNEEPGFSILETPMSIIPNPTHGLTSIRFKASGDVRTIRIVDALGNQVAELPSDLISSEWKSATWNTDNVANGRYYVQVVTTSGIISGSVVVLH